MQNSPGPPQPVSVACVRSRYAQGSEECVGIRQTTKLTGAILVMGPTIEMPVIAKTSRRVIGVNWCKYEASRNVWMEHNFAGITPFCIDSATLRLAHRNLDERLSV